MSYYREVAHLFQKAAKLVVFLSHNFFLGTFFDVIRNLALPRDGAALWFVGGVWGAWLVSAGGVCWGSCAWVFWEVEGGVVVNVGFLVCLWVCCWGSLGER